MTVVKHKFNPKTGEFEVVGVVSDILGLFGKPRVNVGKGLIYDQNDLEEMGYYGDKPKQNFAGLDANFGMKEYRGISNKSFSPGDYYGNSLS